MSGPWGVETRVGATSALDAVTGRMTYAGDLTLPDMLHVAFARSTQPHALLRDVETSTALAEPGVVDVITGADTPGLKVGLSVRDYPVLAEDRVMFVGQRLAAVAAIDEPTARRAAESIHGEYEPLPPVLDVDAALDPSGSFLWEPVDEGIDRYPDGNLQGVMTAGGGKIDTAFNRCEEADELTFSFQRMHSAPMEPHTCLIDATGDVVRIWSTNKVPNRLRQKVAESLGRDPADFRVLPIDIGGDFGSKSLPFIEVACVVLSERTGRPVRARLTYQEMLLATAVRHPGWMRIRLGLRHGDLHAYEGEIVLDGGAFAGVKPNPARVVSMVDKALKPYGIPVRDERGMVVSTNNIPGGHVRKPGMFQVIFAAESMIDVTARRRGEDPLDFRLRQAQDPGTRCVLEELRAATAGWSRPDQHLGLGIATFNCGGGRGHTVVRLVATANGVSVAVGTPSQGAGMHTVFRRLTADRLGIPLDRVSIDVVGSDDRLVDSGAGSSRVTQVAGGACLDASERLLDALEPQATTDPDGEYWIAAALEATGHQQVTVLGEHEMTREDAKAVVDSYVGIAVQTAVDPETGVLRVQRALLTIETGRIVDPVGFRGQVEGGFVYGLSQSLYEHLIVEDGQPVTATLGDYKLACIADVPPLEIRFVHRGSEPDEQIRAIGELTNIGVPAAIANSIDDAIGVRLTELPLSAEAIWTALHLGSRSSRRSPNPALRPSFHRFAWRR